MKVLIVGNGKLSMIITPETEIEKLQLQDLSKTNEVSIQFHEKLQIMDKALVDSVVITSKSAT